MAARKNHILRQRDKPNIWCMLQRREQRNTNLKGIKGNKDKVLRITKQIKRQNVDVISEKCIRDDQGIVSLDDEAKKTAQ